MSSSLPDLIERAAEGLAKGVAEEVDASERAYEDRNALAVAFVVERRRMGCDAGYYDDDSGKDWPVVWATLPTGQVSWHLPPEWRETLENELPKVEPVGGYDGHDRELKNERLVEHASGGEERITRPALPSP